MRSTRLAVLVCVAGLAIATPAAAQTAPSPAPGAETPPAPAGPEPVVGGATFSTAPRIDEGRYVDIIRPGETLFYRVPLEVGETVAVTAEFPPADLATGRREVLGLETRILSPLREESDDFIASRTPVLPVAGKVTDPYEIPAIGEAPPFTEPGDYFFELRLGPNEQLDDSQFDVRFTVEISGEPQPGPSPSPSTNPTGSASPSSELVTPTAPESRRPPPSSDVGSGSSTAAPILAGAVGAIGAFASARVLRRRRARGLEGGPESTTGRDA